MIDPTAFVHPTALVEDGARIGAGTKVWHHAHVRAGASLGRECIVGKGAYVGAGVQVGDRCKIQNNALLYEGAVVEDGVFIGPAAILANDHNPRAVTPDGALEGPEDWSVSEIRIRCGAAIGAGAVLIPPIEVGEWAMVGAGAVVTRSVPAHGLALGNPARVVGQVCSCGVRVDDGACRACGRALPVDP